MRAGLTGSRASSAILARTESCSALAAGAISSFGKTTRAAAMARCDWGTAEVSRIDAHINDAGFVQQVLAVFTLKTNWPL